MKWKKVLISALMLSVITDRMRRGEREPGSVEDRIRCGGRRRKLDEGF
ncbi:hypothetical protein LC724_16210 [Blautia sp. RD014234]|nr:hypothetical protein [Blautia parvula]